ncbi:MAG: ABC transporter ATP-binding protein/permease [Eubacteriales bacterium]|nr:ABC transporter ATP-binding protein/permease [Eubacteriales bacterium]
MKTTIEFIRSLYHYSKRKFIGNILLITLNGLTSSIGIVMLIPLLSLVGIAGQSADIPLLGNLLGLLEQYDMATRLVVVLIVYLILAVLQALIDRQSSLVNTEIVQGYTRHLREQLYKSAIETEWTCFCGKKKSDVASAFTNEIARIAAGTLVLLRMLSQIIVTVFQLYVAFLMSVPMTLIVLICGVVIFRYMRTTFKASRTLGNSLHHINQEFTGRVMEQLECIKESKSYGIEKEQITSFSEIAAQSEKNINDFMRLQTKTSLIYKVSSVVVVCVMFYFSIIYLHINPSSLIVIVYIFARLWPQFSSFQSNLQNVLAMLPAFTALTEMMVDLKAHAEELGSAPSGAADTLPSGTVRFTDVSFCYDENGGFALKNISFQIPQRSMVALVGQSGAGKSTVVDLLLGLIKPDEGTITIDGQAIDAGYMRQWRSRVSYVPQAPFLFNTTIRDNLLRFNPGATEEEINDALELAAAAEFVQKLPQGIQTVIGNSGVQLSGGERQRVVLARALLRKPDMLVLDEATSALDSEHEYQIQSALEKLAGRMAVLVIAHRLSTVYRADNIVVLEDGEIMEQGTYGDLSSKEGGVFQKMVRAKGERPLL